MATINFSKLKTQAKEIGVSLDGGKTYHYHDPSEAIVKGIPFDELQAEDLSKITIKGVVKSFSDIEAEAIVPVKTGLAYDLTAGDTAESGVVTEISVFKLDPDNIDPELVINNADGEPCIFKVPDGCAAKFIDLSDYLKRIKEALTPKEVIEAEVIDDDE